MELAVLTKRLFPEISRDTVLKRIEENWDFTYGIPLPKFDLICPICKSSEVMARAWKYHKRVGSKTSPYRCDFSAKCTRCSFVMTWGVLLTLDQYEHPNWTEKSMWTWRRVQKKLAAFQ